MYPLIMSPYFRHGEATPWGGSVLGDLFMKEIPDERTGESLEVSCLSGMESVIKNGPLAGQSLSSAIKKWGTGLVGDIGDEFPLLIKLLDAREMLSVQVHPGDAYAREHEGKLGKTEAWLVLCADPGAKLAYGIKTDRAGLEKCVEENRFEDALNWVSVRAGDVLYIPSGTVHALGGGIQVYEVQQSSDVTYRFYDWNRVGRDGRPRELHTQKALDVTVTGKILPKCEGATVLTKGGSITYFISNDYFELCRLNVCGRMPLDTGRFHLVTTLEPCKITWDEGEIEPLPFETVVIPADLPVTIEGNMKAIMSSPSKNEELRQVLGYRAENVAGLQE